MDPHPTRDEKNRRGLAARWADRRERREIEAQVPKGWTPDETGRGWVHPKGGMTIYPESSRQAAERRNRAAGG